MDNFSSTDLSSSPKRGRYRKRSEIWKFFVQVDNENEISPIKCTICGKQFSFKSTASNLYRHLNRCHNVEATSLVKHSTQKITILNFQDSSHKTIFLFLRFGAILCMHLPTNL